MSKIIIRTPRATLPCILNEQFAYRQSNGCEDALAVCIDSWQHSLDDGNVVAVAILDLSKGVDCVQHDKLLLQIQSFGIDGIVLGWLCSYLASRQQQIVCHCNPSGEQYPANCVVPQGSVLGPLLFSLYTHSLPTCLAFPTGQPYADDTNVYVADKTADAEN